MKSYGGSKEIEKASAKIGVSSAWRKPRRKRNSESCNRRNGVKKISKSLALMRKA
jgi:hypothetical protein